MVLFYLTSTACGFGGTAILKLRSTPQARVFMAGKDMGITPIALKLKPGKETEIVLIENGYKNRAKIYVLKAGEVRKEKIILEPKERTVRIISDPEGAEILLNGQQLLSEDFEQLRTPADVKVEYGTQFLTLRLDPYMDLKKKIVIKDDSEQIYYKLYKPGRLTVKVPRDYKEASVYLNGELLGEMRGKVTRHFDIEASVPHTIYVKHVVDESTVYLSKTEVVEAPEGGRTTFLVEYLIQVDRNQSTEEQLAQVEERVEDLESGNTVWHVTAITVALAAGIKSYMDITARNELAEENKSLESQYNSTVSTSDRSALRAKFEENEKEIETYESSAQIFDTITAVAVIAELLLYSSDSFSASKDIDHKMKNGWQPAVKLVGVGNHKSIAGIKLQWKW